MCVPDTQQVFRKHHFAPCSQKEMQILTCILGDHRGICTFCSCTLTCLALPSADELPQSSRRMGCALPPELCSFRIYRNPLAFLPPISSMQIQAGMWCPHPCSSCSVPHLWIKTASLCNITPGNTRWKLSCDGRSLGCWSRIPLWCCYKSLQDLLVVAHSCRGKPWPEPQPLSLYIKLDFLHLAQG